MEASARVSEFRESPPIYSADFVLGSIVVYGLCRDLKTEDDWSLFATLDAALT